MHQVVFACEPLAAPVETRKEGGLQEIYRSKHLRVKALLVRYNCIAFMESGAEFLETWYPALEASPVRLEGLKGRMPSEVVEPAKEFAAWSRDVHDVAGFLLAFVNMHEHMDKYSWHESMRLMLAPPDLFAHVLTQVFVKDPAGASRKAPEE